MAVAIVAVPRLYFGTFYSLPVLIVLLGAAACPLVLFDRKRRLHKLLVSNGLVVPGVVRGSYAEHGDQGGLCTTLS